MLKILISLVLYVSKVYNEFHPYYKYSSNNFSITLCHRDIVYIAGSGATNDMIWMYGVSLVPGSPYICMSFPALSLSIYLIPTKDKTK